MDILTKGLLLDFREVGRQLELVCDRDWRVFRWNDVADDLHMEYVTCSRNQGLAIGLS